jgi:hypothetical protein
LQPTYATRRDARVKYELIDRSAAPAKPGAPKSQRATVVQAIVADLGPGKVAKVELEGSETPRGTKASISRAARSAGRPVAVWSDDRAVYVELAEEKRAGKRRGRPRKNH